MKSWNIIIILFLFISGCVIANKKQVSKPTYPNIIYILADDLSYRDLSYYGQKQFSTPNLDLLAQKSILFTNAYAGAPECAPSRGTLLTGLHTGHSPIRANASVRGQEFIPDSVTTIAEVLKGQGYSTGFVGKWGVGLPESEGVPEKQGFDFAFGFYNQGRAHTFFPRFLMKNGKKQEYPANYQFDMDRRYKMNASREPYLLNEYDKDGKLILSEYSDPTKAVYAQNKIDEAAFDFINKNIGSPFFLYYATQLPHGPVIIDDLGEMNHNEVLPQRQKEWAAMVKRLDSFVGDLIKYLKDKGEYDNTIIFFSSDNGYSHCGYMGRGNAPNWEDDPYLKNKGPFRGGKFSTLEGGLRIPFFISAPALFNAKKVDTPVWLVDFFSTATELAKIKKTPPNDGKSLVPILKGESPNVFENRPLYFSKNTEQAVRIGEWKAYRQSPTHPIELYLIEKDSYSQNDLAQEFPKVVKTIEKIMDTSHLPHQWYRNPWETDKEFREKKEQAKRSKNVFKAVRPNGL